MNNIHAPQESGMWQTDKGRVCGAPCAPLLLWCWKTCCPGGALWLSKALEEENSLPITRQTSLFVLCAGDSNPSGVT